MKRNPKYLFLFILIGSQIYAQYGQSDWENRDRWMNVMDLFKLADLGADHKAADVGCHEGYLTVHLSKVVGGQGKVYAVDVREDRLERLKKNIKKRKLQNIEVILGDYDDPKLPVAELDVVFVIDTYHEIEENKIMLAHLKKSLKSGGRLVLLEKIKKHMKGKIREQQVISHTLSMKYVKTELIDAGFTINREVANFGQWENDLDKTMWVLVATKP